MVKELMIRNISYNNEYVDAIIKMYIQFSELSFFPPNIQDLFRQYDAVVDTRIVHLQVQIYGDDFYDGRPGSNPTLLPDMIRDNLEENIKIPVETTIEDIANVLNSENLVYHNGTEVLNGPILGVW